MCGIAGVFDRNGSAVAESLAIRMRDTLSHRGPDGEGLWMRPGRADVALGHRRLAIVDLSPAGAQPMANEDGTVQVTFNGEIYNHLELRADLERRGHRFRGRCDAEVLVHLYEEYGARMVDRLVGMFAFAIWDEHREELLVARDRVGIKPLYWLDDGERFGFASEIKALLPLLQRRELDPEALAAYLTFVCVPPPKTLFAGISKLAPATTMVIGRDGVRRPVTYWDPVANRERLDGVEPGDWLAELRLRLERSVERRMMSDVPVGVFLSGGVDSSTNVALMSQIASPVRTFSIGFDDAPDYNEFDWARRVADQYGTEHHEMRINAESLWRMMPELVYHQDEPIADPVCVPLYHVARLAKDSGVTVVHVGEGADELFAGYPTYATALGMTTGPWQRLRGLPAPMRRGLASLSGPLERMSPRHQIHLEALRRGAHTDAHLWWGGAVAFYERGFAQVTTQGFRDALAPGIARDVVAGIAADANRHGAAGELDRLIYQDLRLRLPELLLMRVDKLTMASAIEARVPFLDHELVELAMGMPPELKIADGIGKTGLKQVVSDLLPHDLIYRPKQGFGAPVAQWFRGELGDRLRTQLESSAINEMGWLDGHRIREIADLHASGRADRSFQLWNLLNLSFWFDHWVADREPTVV
jgi:asparagine synthase (glutamine-hydrolysing)